MQLDENNDAYPLVLYHDRRNFLTFLSESLKMV